MNAPFIEPPVGGTIDHILSVLPSLVPSAQRVARICAERPEDVVDMSGADLAVAADTSAATVSRACQALGFRGFQHLRLLLVRDLGASSGRAAASEGTSGWLDVLAQGSAEIISTSLGAIDLEAFDQAVRAVAEAPRLLVAGAGLSGPAAQSAALRFTMNGRPCEAPVDTVAQQLTANVLSRGDVCLVVSASGANAATIAVAVAAAEAGATVIGVTSYARSPLAEYAHHLLVAGARFRAWDSGAVGSGLVQLLVLTALQMAVAERMNEQAERAQSAVRDGVLGLIADEGFGS